MKKLISTTLFVIGGVPLCMYPFVLATNLMSLAGDWPAQVNILLTIVFCLFLLASSTYPITYIVCILLFKKEHKKIPLSVIPLIHLLITIGLFYLWDILATKK